MIGQNIFYVFIFFALIGVCPIKAQYYSVNFDYKTIASMVGAYAEEAGTEAMVRQNTSDIAESYGYSEVATAGIFASKLLDRNALKSSKGFGNPDENFYYKKAYRLVANKIIPRTISVTKKLIKEPSTSIYWGSHLLRVMADTKSLCNQFSALCSNSSLSFSDIPFVEFTGTLQNYRSNDGYSYSITTWAHGYSCYRTKNGNFNGYYAYSIAYEVKVTRSWYNKEVFYEDTFDSYSMDWNTFMNVMYAKLNEANSNESGKTYRIGYDTKRYYTATNARKLAGATLATFKSRCESDGKLVDGTVQYKCSSCGGSPSEHTKQCAMATSLSDNSFNYDEINNAISNTESLMSQKKSQIDAYNKRNNEILSALTKTNDYEEQNRLRQEYSQNRREIEALQGEYDSLNSQLSELRNAKQQAIDFENSQQDGYDRIPSIMHNLQSNFSLEWLEEGHWDGFTFVRTAKMRNLKSTVTFKATVSISRRPKYFLGIKIHRAIVQISWELLAEYNDESVIETMQLDPNSNQEEQTSKVNQRLSELQRQYPDCDVSVDYEYASGQEPEEDDDDDKIHLLWASDRLDACREIVRRLEAIYVDLVVLDKYLHYKYSILDWLKDMTVNRLNADRGRRLSIAERSRRRWMHNAGSAIFEREEEDDNYEEE